MPAAIPFFSYPFALKKDTLKGLRYRNACSNSCIFISLSSRKGYHESLRFQGMPAAIPLFSCPLALKKDTMKNSVLKECLQQFLYFSNLLAIKKDTLKGIVDSPSLSCSVVLAAFVNIMLNHFPRRLLCSYVNNVRHSY